MDHEFTLGRIRGLIAAGMNRLEELNWFVIYRDAGFKFPPFSDRFFLTKKIYYENIDQELKSLLFQLGNIAVDLGEAGEFELSIACMTLFSLFFKDNISAHFSIGTSLLSLGRHSEAAPHMIAWNRLSVQGSRPDLTVWAGEDLTGKTLLVVSNQGIGDMVQFMRFLFRIPKNCQKTYFFVGKPLHRMIGEIDDVEIVSSIPEHFDYITDLEALPHLIGIDEATLGRDVPYLQPDHDLVKLWQPRLPAGEFKIGVVWGSGPQQADGRDMGRGMPLACFAPLAQIPGVTLISLQMVSSYKTIGTYPDGTTGESLARGIMTQLDNLPDGMSVARLGPEFNAGPDNMVDTIAVMRSLDLIISTDTSVPHVAAACGFPVWILLRHVPDWRWMMGREDSPWYPTMRLFRQPRPGDWSGVMEQVTRELRGLVAKKHAAAPGQQPVSIVATAPKDIVGPVMARALYGEGLVYLSRACYTDSMAALQKSLALTGGHWPEAKDALALACLGWAEILEQRHCVVEAEACLRKALGLSTQFTAAKTLLAQVLTRKAKIMLDESLPVAAALAAREAFALDPSGDEVRQFLRDLDCDGQLAAALRDPDSENLAQEEAMRRNSLRESPDDSMARPALAASLYGQAIESYNRGDLPQAESRLRQCLEIWPTMQEARNSLAVTCFVRGVPLFNSQRFTEAESLFWEALSLDPNYKDPAHFIDLCARHPARTVVKMADPAFSDDARRLLDALQVKDLAGAKLVRMGDHGDGGFVMADRGLEGKIAYSLGIGDDISWDLAMVERGCHIFQYDHTIDHLPVEHPNLHWSKIGLSGTQSDDPTFRTLEALITGNNHGGEHEMILKTDIEGAEWEIIASLPDHLLCQFSQIVGEFHNLSRFINKNQRDIIFTALEKLNRHFQLVHVHANNYSTITVVGGVVVYGDVELTFVRRSGNSFHQSRRSRPIDVDFPCKADCAEYILRAFGA